MINSDRVTGADRRTVLLRRNVGEIHLRAFICFQNQGGLSGRPFRQVGEEIRKAFISKEFFLGGDGEELRLEGILPCPVHTAGHLRVVREAANRAAFHHLPAGKALALQGGSQGIVLHRAGLEDQLIRPGEHPVDLLRGKELGIPEFIPGQLYFVNKTESLLSSYDI